MTSLPQMVNYILEWKVESLISKSENGEVEF